jgi:hypothetical protein
MDLALHLGTPVEPLRRSMTEREFRWWADYSRKNWLPLQRIEWYLARIAQVIAVTNGAKDAPLSDFLLVLEQEQKTAQVIDIDTMRQAFGFNPRNRKKAA